MFRNYFKRVRRGISQNVYIFLLARLRKEQIVLKIQASEPHDGWGRDLKNSFVHLIICKCFDFRALQIASESLKKVRFAICKQFAIVGE